MNGPLLGLLSEVIMHERDPYASMYLRGCLAISNMILATSRARETTGASLIKTDRAQFLLIYNPSFKSADVDWGGVRKE
jgi:hypothetical protein